MGVEHVKESGLAGRELRLPRVIELLGGEERDPASPCVLEALILDQTKLPYEQAFIRTTDWRAVVDAVKMLQVRGAPALGVAGAAAVALAAAELVQKPTGPEGARAGDAFLRELGIAAEAISAARPTAVNLRWGVERALELACEHVAAGAASIEAVCALANCARDIAREDEACNRAIGRHGAALLPQGVRVLTHCNAGSLATSYFGTALGIVYTAFAQGKVERVYADETRPLGQGSRLTAWELAQAGVPVTLICDNMAASIMAAGLVDAVVVGADRITANGDVANKIGTYGVAVLARHHGIPFYVAAPSSTVDAAMASGSEIPIEQRAASEVLSRPLDGVDVLNPAFDVTPAALVTAIVTERGVFAPEDIAREYGAPNAL